MVDIHSHILPGIDDGSPDLETSVAMVRMAAESGTTDIVATPHSNLQFPFRPEAIEEKIRELAAACDGCLRIHRGCDFHLSFDNIQDALQRPERYTINHLNYLMVEFPDQQIAKIIDDVLLRFIGSGIVPVITHPERNLLLSRDLDRMKRWVDAGCGVQVTAQSLLGRFGKTAKAAADEMMGRNLVHFIASDAHDARDRTPVLKPAYDHVAATWGEERAHRLLVDNPAATLVGGEIAADEGETDRPTKKWYQFWS